ncbi:ABC transporter permease [Viridibacterium curvum]|uniref:ABC transporter permease n=2 Tax=Viridibacterium curvum TaxID=1101404 RepID=A0ABP9QV56_9RHOO
MSDSNTSVASVQVNMANLRGGIEHASQWTLMWLRFKKHKLALISMYIVLGLYIMALFSEFLAPFDPEEALKSNGEIKAKAYHPPQPIHLFDDKGFNLHVQILKETVDPVSLKKTYVPDGDRKIELSFFVRGFEYNFLGLFKSDIHLFGAKEKGAVFYLFGSDRQGRDMFSRVIYGGRFTLSLGLIGVFLSVVLGLILGGISGYYGGKIDWFIQRLVEFIISLPTIPIWLAMAAVLPKDWPPHYQYMAVTVIISLIGWTQLARVVRGRLLAMRGEVFVIAAQLDGCSEARVIFRHMLPSLASHIIAAVTLAIPMMILAETSLSFLGLGLQPPAISWGVLLKEAQNIRSIAAAPWLFIPGAMVVIAVLALNFMGDGLRDAADPYTH